MNPRYVTVMTPQGGSKFHVAAAVGKRTRCGRWLSGFTGRDLASEYPVTCKTCSGGRNVQVVAAWQLDLPAQLREFSYLTVWPNNDLTAT